MITKLEYIEALDVVGKYHAQIGLIRRENIHLIKKTKVAEWEMLSSCSRRLIDALTYLRDFYIEDIDRQMLFRLRNTGRKTVMEFEHLVAQEKRLHQES